MNKISKMKIIAPQNSGGQQKLAEILGEPIWWSYTNPLSWIRAGKKSKDKNTWLVYWNPVFFIPLFVIYIFSTTRLNLIVENAVPHHRFPFAYFFIKFFLKRSNEVIVYSQKVFEQIMPYCNPILQKLPHAQEMNFDLATAIKPNTVLMLGFIRGYKGLDTFLQSFWEVKANIPEVTFLIVGKFRGFLWWKYKSILKNFPSQNVIVKNKRVTDEEFKQYIQNANVMVFPYKRITQSGVLNYAIKAKKKIVATPALKEFLPTEDIFLPGEFAKGIIQKLADTRLN
jgi:glycosyltransferase involved in cell wall biosynthesis